MTRRNRIEVVGWLSTTVAIVAATVASIATNRLLPAVPWAVHAFIGMVFGMVLGTIFPAAAFRILSSWINR